MNHRKILFVDDEEPIRVFMEKAINRLGYQAKVADSAITAVSMLEEEDFPLIITDLKMPGMDGVQFCKQVRKTNHSSVIYALSGFINEYNAEKLEEFGFDGYLTKPSKLDVLKQAIEGAFEKIDKNNGS